MNRAKILFIDDDPAIQAAVAEYLQIQGYVVQQVTALKAAYEALEKDTPDIVIIDYQLPDGDAIEFLRAIRSMNAPTKCIVLTGYGTIDLAVRATKEGAEQFVTKPVQLSVLASYVKSCLEKQQQQRKQLAKKLIRPRYEKNPFSGTSTLIQRLAEEANKIVQTERPILIQGETGTGKGVLAAWIHRAGPRAEEALVDVNCAGLSKELLESELFGYEKGAFTGAANSKPGLVEVAHRGILFLDELGEMDLLVQPKFLKVLEDNRFRRLGDVRERVADIQLIAATNRNLLHSVTEMYLPTANTATPGEGGGHSGDRQHPPVKFGQGPCSRATAAQPRCGKRTQGLRLAGKHSGIEERSGARRADVRFGRD